MEYFAQTIDNAFKVIYIGPSCFVQIMLKKEGTIMFLMILPFEM